MRADELTADTMCTMRCMRVAVLVADGDPFCYECCDAVVLACEPPMESVYKAEEDRLRPMRPLPYIETAEDREKLEAMQEWWRQHGIEILRRYGFSDAA
jgi:hypothetical protein